MKGNLHLLIISILLPAWAFNPSVSKAQPGKEEKKEFSLSYHFSDKDSSFEKGFPSLKNSFGTETEARKYLAQLPALLQSSGYPGASVDSLREDGKNIHVWIFKGPGYKWMRIVPRGIKQEVLEAVGFNSESMLIKPADIFRARRLQSDLLAYYENNGYPFAKVWIDSLTARADSITAYLYAEPSVFYRIDSLRKFGEARISDIFLERYLSIRRKSVFDRSKLNNVDKRLSELPFLNVSQPSDMTLLGNGSVLNLYLEPKKSSQVNLILGLLPPSGQYTSMQLTGDLLLDLKNPFGRGESLLVKWQQLQRKSPRLNLGFVQPYIFNSAVGFDFLFDLFRKDSSFLQVNTMAGLDYFFSTARSGKIYLQWQSNSLLEGGLDTNRVKAERRLPANIDVNSASLGGQYRFSGTNYRFNPSRGFEGHMNASAGVKNIRKNDQITSLKDDSFNYGSLYDSIQLSTFQVRARANVAVYFTLKEQAVMKLAFSGGIYLSPEVFRNELFQIGGFNLLRGFDDESIFADRYAVITAEYRFLVGRNSFLFAFADGGLTRTLYPGTKNKNSFMGLGGGIYYETKTGLINICYAAGFRNDVNFDIRESSKLHFGYNHYF